MPFVKPIQILVREYSAWFAGMGLLLVLTAFAACRIPAISLPPFWDELGVYGPSVFYLMENGVDLQPKALHPELSRGHPMLYVFTQALIGAWFGGSVQGLHLLNLLLALCLLICTFFLGRKVLGVWGGLLAALWLSVQPLLHAQATLILPEILLALVTVGMIYGYITKNMLLYVFCGVLAVLIKETAILIPAALLLDSLCIWIRNGSLRSIPALWKESWWLVIPWIAFGIFLLVQKQQNGWYLFPYHTGLFDWRFAAIAGKLADYLRFLFIEQGRYTLTLLLAGAYAIGSGRLRFQKGTGLYSKSGQRDKAAFFPAAIWVGTLLLLFSSTNAYMNRYVLLLFPLLAVLASAALLHLWRYRPRRTAFRLIFPLMVVLVCVVPWITPARHFAYDEHPNYRRQVYLLKTVVNELMVNPVYKGVAVQANWPIHDALYYDWASYRAKTLPFYLMGPSDSLDFIVRVSPGSQDFSPDTALFRPIWTKTDRGMVAEIYQNRAFHAPPQ